MIYTSSDRGGRASPPGAPATICIARAMRIFRTYGADAIQVWTENPVAQRAVIGGIGFKTDDAIAHEMTAMVRVRKTDTACREAA